MTIAIITIDSFVTQEAGFIKFKDKSQKTWNCNKPELIQMFAAGNRYKIDYNETQPKPGFKFGSKYINQARDWREADGPNSWPDKEPYTGGGSNFSSGGNMNKKNDYDPEIGKRQTAANCAANIIAHYVNATKKVDLDEINVILPTLADMFLKFVDTKGVQPVVPAAGVSDFAEDSDGIEF